MKILALETNESKLKAQLISPMEQLLLCVHYSGFLFGVRLFKDILGTLVIIAIGIAITMFTDISLWFMIPILIVLWVIFVGSKLLRAWIDWKHDVLFVTTDKIIIVDQSSIWRIAIRQMNIENVATVTAESQFADVFPFGALCFDLKEGTGEKLRLPYVPKARIVASQIANIVMDFQGRRAVKATNIDPDRM